MNRLMIVLMVLYAGLCLAVTCNDDDNDTAGDADADGDGDIDADSDTDKDNAGWNEVESTVTIDLFRVKFMSESEGWIVGESGTILRTIDQGDTWTSASNSATDEYLYDLDFVGNTVYVCGSEMTLLKGANNGTGFEWTNITIPGGTDFYRRVQFLSSQTGWVLETNWHRGFVRLWYSLDNLSWAEANGIPNAEDFEAKDFQFTQNQIPDGQDGGKLKYEGWLIGYEGDSPDGTAYLYHTVNGGEDWSVALEDSDSYFSDIYFLDKDHGWIAKTWGMLYTEDGGKNWESLDFTASGVSPDILKFTDSNNGWAVAGINNPYHTENGGSGWQEQVASTGKISGVADIFMINSSVGILVGDDGKIYKTITGGK